MKLSHVLAGAALAAFLVDAAGADPLPMDTPITLGTVETACTGIGEGKDDPRWASYPIRVEFSNAGSQYLSGAHVKLADAAGKPLAEFDCLGSWVLLRVPRGIYTVSATVDGQNVPARSAKFEPPASGQKRIVLQFTDIPANQ